MTLLDSDILTLYFAGNERVVARVRESQEVPATTIISRIELVQGRFDSVIKAANGEQLLRAQARLTDAETALGKFKIMPFDPNAASEFDRLRHNKKLRVVGRNGLLIACIARAHHAKLVTRNTRHFRLIPGLTIENWAD